MRGGDEEGGMEYSVRHEPAQPGKWNLAAQLLPSQFKLNLYINIAILRL